ncbi:Epoxide hydrolase [Trichostrongylus colubriformis]|uniref:Epoxide hydrolase n=1 Tax=Trichostrongylus colubriformis TaxID=6319 RepID=A0AAN8FHT9_TRICO
MLLRLFPTVVTLILFAIPLLFTIWLEHVPLHESEEVAEDSYWENGYGLKDNERIEVFKVDIADEQIQHLKERLSEERLVAPFEDCPLSVARHSFLKNLSEVMTSLNWNQHQYFLNTFKQYRTEIEGLDIHFLRISLPKESSKDTVPLLMLHGFPGSYWDFFKVIPILTNPTRFGFDFGVKRPLLFEVIIPSLPGFLFSDKPSKTDIARIMAKLMKRLNVNTYFVQGSELLGTEIAAVMSGLYPTRVRGVHLSNPLVHPQFSPQVFTKYLIEDFIGFGSSEISTTKKFLEAKCELVPPGDSIENALISSPLGTASYLMSTWSYFSSRDRSIQLNRLFTLDELATISYLYYLTETTPHTLRIMRKFLADDLPKQRLQVRVPCGIQQSPEVPWNMSRSIARHRFLNITSFTTAPKGGAFLHLQDPQNFAADVFRFVERILM